MIFDEIRAACAAVAAEARRVRIDVDRLAARAGALADAAAEGAALDPAHHLLGRGEATLAYVLTLDAVNFGSGWFPQLDKEPGLSGYFTVATRLARHMARDGPIAPAALARLEAADCFRLFGQDPANEAVAALMALFARALNDLGRLVATRYDGRFPALVEAAGHSAAQLVALLRTMPLYDDVALWRGRRVPLLKRAQLTVADLALAFDGDPAHGGWGRFDDLDRLTIFADNVVPHVLRVDGVLAYDPALAAAIDAGETVPAGSEAETEIRAVALHAVELLAARIAAAGRPVPPRRLDVALWNRGRAPSYKAVPRHRTRCAYY